MIKNEGKQMKFGEILDFRTKDKAVIGKKYAFSDNLFRISNSPEGCSVNFLNKVEEGKNFPFSDRWLGFQFIREIIEEEPKYRPYKDTNELKADFFKEDRLDISKRHRPAIWIVSSRGIERQIEGFSSISVLINGVYYSMKELFENFTYLDGTPCGIMDG